MEKLSRTILCQTCEHPVHLKAGEDNTCENCNCKIKSLKKKDAAKTLSYALTALILYFPANFLPVMSIEMYGQKNESTIWQGIVSLAEGGDWILALIVFLASMFVPFLKLLVLFYLSLTAKSKKNQRFKTKLFHFIEVIGPWSMLDIFLVAVLVAVIKFGSMATVTVGVGALMFLLVVIFTMLAAASFDVRLLWRDSDER